MSTLQIRNLPDDIYKKLTILAKKENRSIARQATAMLRDALGFKKNNKTKREALIAELDDSPIKVNLKNKMNAVEMIREDRER